MAPTFLQALSRDTGIAVIWMVRVAGIPYIFANQSLPTEWDAGSGTVTWLDGDTYTWQPSLIL